MAIELDPDRTDGWYYRGQNFRLSGDIEAAFKDLKKSVSLEMPPRNASLSLILLLIPILILVSVLKESLPMG